MKRNQPALQVKIADVVNIVARRSDLPLPINSVAFLSRLASIESGSNAYARNGSHYGLFQFSVERANEIAHGSYHVEGGFCDALRISRVSVKSLYDPVVQVALGLDSLIWANVGSFEQFYCLHILPGAFMLVEKGGKSRQRGITLFYKYVFGKQSNEAQLVVKKGLRQVIS